jgi:hypothetical protein
MPKCRGQNNALQYQKNNGSNIDIAISNMLQYQNTKDKITYLTEPWKLKVNFEEGKKKGRKLMLVKIYLRVFLPFLLIPRYLVNLSKVICYDSRL